MKGRETVTDRLRGCFSVDVLRISPKAEEWKKRTTDDHAGGGTKRRQRGKRLQTSKRRSRRRGALGGSQACALGSYRISPVGHEEGTISLPSADGNQKGTYNG